MLRNLIVLCLFAQFAGYAADVPVVNNGKKPAGKAITLKLTEDLRIGPDDDEEHFLWGGFGGALAVNKQGHIFVVDPANFRIVQVDPSGTYVRDIGRQGGGPGEFQALSGFQILADGRGAAFEALGPGSRFSIFDKDMKFVERQPVSQPGLNIGSAILSPDTKLLFALKVAVNQEKSTIDQSYIMLNNEGEIKETFMAYDQPLPNPAELGNQDALVKLMGKQFQVFSKGHFAYVAYDRDQFIYTANANKYEITQWDGSFKKKRIIKRDYQPVTQNEEDIFAIVDPIYETLHSRLPPNIQAVFTRNALKRAIEMAEFPASALPIYGLNRLADGTLVVVHKRDLPGKSMESDLFDREGKYLGSFKQVMPGSVGLYTTVFQDNFMYNLEVNDEGDTFMVRYKYEKVAK